MYSGTAFLYLMFQMSATPSTSLCVSSFVLYDATSSSGCCKAKVKVIYKVKFTYKVKVSISNEKGHFDYASSSLDQFNWK